MIHRFFSFLTTLALVAAAVPALAQDPKGVTINGGIGFTKWDDDRNLEDDPLFHFSGGYRFDNPWAVELGVISGNPNGDGGNTDIDMTQWRVDGLYHFGTDSGYLKPFVSFGLGNGKFDYAGAEIDETLLNVGVGARVMLSDTISFRSDLKLFRGQDSEASDLMVLLGLQYHLGGMDRSTPSREAPMRTSRAAAPQDPDSDGDGVPDSSDRCQGTAPATPVDSRGCPRDTDGDGVPDVADRCPGTSQRGARIDANGCYVVLEETVSVRLDVKFDTNSDETRPAHRDEVARVYRFMQEYPQTSVTIEGHTDNTGDAAYNKDLSERRARAIADLLIEEFDIDADRVKAVGYGEERPAATNETAAGRQENRRVVAVIETTVERIEESM